MKAFHANIRFGIILATLIGAGVLIDRGTAQAQINGWCQPAAQSATCPTGNNCVSLSEGTRCRDKNELYFVYTASSIIYSQCDPSKPTPKSCTSNNVAPVNACTITGYLSVQGQFCSGEVCSAITRDIQCTGGNP